jgi:hypothetical protein
MRFAKFYSRLKVDCANSVIPVTTGIQLLHFPPNASLDAGLRRHDGTSSSLKPRDFNDPRAL